MISLTENQGKKMFYLFTPVEDSFDIQGPLTYNEARRNSIDSSIWFDSDDRYFFQRLRKIGDTETKFPYVPKNRVPPEFKAWIDLLT